MCQASPMTKLPLTLMMWNWGLKRQHRDCLSMGIKNLAELSLCPSLALWSSFSLALLLVQKVLVIPLRRDTEYNFIPNIQSSDLATYAMSDKTQTRKNVCPCLTKKRFVIWALHPGLATIHWYCFLNKARQSRTKQADSCDKDAVLGSNLLLLLTIFNLI